MTVNEKRLVFAHSPSSASKSRSDDVGCSLCELSKIIRRVSSGDAAERVNRMNPRAARLARQAGDTKLIVSMRGNKTRARALSSLVWALGACKGMMQSRSGRGPAQSDDPPLPDTPGAQQLDTSLHAVPSMCPPAISPTLLSLSPLVVSVYSNHRCLHPAVPYPCIGALLFPSTPPCSSY